MRLVDCCSACGRYMRPKKKRQPCLRTQPKINTAIIHQLIRLRLDPMLHLPPKIRSTRVCRNYSTQMTLEWAKTDGKTSSTPNCKNKGWSYRKCILSWLSEEKKLKTKKDKSLNWLIRTRWTASSRCTRGSMPLSSTSLSAGYHSTKICLLDTWKKTSNSWWSSSENSVYQNFCTKKTCTTRFSPWGSTWRSAIRSSKAWSISPISTWHANQV